MLSLLIAALAIASAAYGQSSNDDEPIPGDYSGALRPQIHFSPPVGFMNDPNGMFLDANGTYHLYYQCALHFPSCLRSTVTISLP